MSIRSFLWLAGLCLVASLSAQTPVVEADRWAFAANLGWVDLRPGEPDGVRATATHLGGRAYGANFGWVDFGDGSPVAPAGYANNTATDFGVNRDPQGYLSGYAYAANLGWIHFGWSTVDGRRPRLDPTTGRLTGLAYAANAGWITLGEITDFAVEMPDPALETAVRVTLNLPTGAITRAQLATLTRLDLRGLGVRNLTGLRHAPNLETLEIDGLDLADISDVVGLTIFPSLRVRNTWVGGFVGAPRASASIENWWPRRPPETFAGFTNLDDMVVTQPGARVDLSTNHNVARSFVFEAPGGELALANSRLTTSAGLSLRAGAMTFESSNELSGPVETAAGTTVNVNIATAIFNDGLTHQGRWQQQGSAVYARRILNEGEWTLEDEMVKNWVYGPVIGRPGSRLTIASAVAPPEAVENPTESNSFFGSLAWAGGGSSLFSIAPRAASYFSLTDPSDSSTDAESTRRFVYTDGRWELGTEALFVVLPQSLEPYDLPEPQIALERLAIANAGRLRLSGHSIALRDLTVEGQPVEVVGLNFAPSAVQELRQGPETEGTLRAWLYGGFQHRLLQPRLEGAVDLWLGRNGFITTVEVGDLTNAAHLNVYGSVDGPTTITAATGSPRTVTNAGTLRFSGPSIDFQPALANTGTVLVERDTVVTLATLSEQTGTFTVEGGIVTIGPRVPDDVTDATPRLPLTLRSGRFDNGGSLAFRMHRLNLLAGPGFAGQSVGLDHCVLNLGYPLGAGAPPPPAQQFTFVGRNRVIAEPEVPPPDNVVLPPLVAAGSNWLIGPAATVESSGLVNAGNIYFFGSINDSSAAGALRTSSEIVNLGEIQSLVKGEFGGRLINQGVWRISSGVFRVQAATNATEAPDNIVANYGNIEVWPTARLEFNRTVSPSARSTLLHAGGVIDNQGEVVFNQEATFDWADGRLTGRPVAIEQGTLRLADEVLGGTVVFRNGRGTLDVPQGVVVEDVTLRCESTVVLPLGARSLTNRGVMEMAPPDGDTLVEVSWGRFINEGLVALRGLTGGTPRARYAGDVDNRGRWELEPGSQLEFFLGSSFIHRGLLQLGPSTLFNMGDFMAFEALPGSLICGAGRLVQGPEPILLNGQVEPEGRLVVQGSPRLGGRLLSKLRRVGESVVADEFEATGTLDLNGARLVLAVAEADLAPTPGVRYVVARAESIVGTPAGVFVGPRLARHYRAVGDIVGGTLGITLQPLALGEQSFGRWAGAYEMAGQLPSATSDLNDNGLPALLEYAFGLGADASEAGRAVDVVPAPANGVVVLEFPWDDLVRDVTWRIECAPSLGSAWTEVTGVTAEIGAPGDDGRRTVRYTLPGVGRDGFYRIVAVPGTPPL